MSKIEDEVCRKIQERAKFGYRKYKTTLEREDLTEPEWLVHLQEELMDALNYSQKLMEMEKTKNEKYRSVGWARKSNDGEYFGLWKNKDDVENIYNNYSKVELFEEIPRYDNWEIDKPCYTSKGCSAHYAGLSDTNNPCFWDSGRTSHTEHTRVQISELFSIEEYNELVKENERNSN